MGKATTLDDQWAEHVQQWWFKRPQGTPGPAGSATDRNPYLPIAAVEEPTTEEEIARWLRKEMKANGTAFDRDVIEGRLVLTGAVDRSIPIRTAPHLSAPLLPSKVTLERTADEIMERIERDGAIHKSSLIDVLTRYIVGQPSSSA